MKLLDRYEVLSELGRGHDGTVYAVRDLVGSEQLLAVKTCAAGSSRQARERLMQEFQILQYLNHPNIISAHDYHNISDSHPTLFTMELFYGAPLLARCQDLKLETLLFIFSLTATALDHIHRQGIIHGDLKSANILIDLRTDTPDVRITDFSSAFHTRVRLERAVAQTSSYTPPEVIAGHRPGRKSDLYSLGVLFYRALEASQAVSVNRHQKASAQYTKPLDEGVRELSKIIDPRLADLLQSLLRTSPSERTITASDLSIGLRGILGERAPDPYSAHLTLASRWPCAGRERVLSQGRQFLEVISSSRTHPRSNDKQALMFTAQGGTGKSRMLRELRHESQCMGVQWAQATCRPSSAPMQPLLKILKIIVPIAQLLAKENQYCRDVLHKYRTVLDRLITSNNIEDATLSTWAEERATWVPDQISRFVLRLSEQFPFVLAFDDFHHADISTIRCIDALLNDEGTGQFLIILSGRGNSEPINLSKSSRERIRTIALEPLSLQELETLVTSLLPEGDDQRFLARELDRLAGGNPEHTEITLRRLEAIGAFQLGANGFSLSRHLITSLEQPEEVRSSVQALVLSLEPRERTILRTLSITDRPIQAAWLPILNPELASGKLLSNSLLSLSRSGLIELTGSPVEGVVQFAHALLPEALYQSLPKKHRIRLHANAAQLLTTPDRPPSAELASEIASHLQRAGQSGKAAKYAVIAGRLSARTFSLGEAENYYRLAVENLPRGRSDSRLDALEGLGETLIALGHLDEAAEVLTNLKRDASELQKPEYLARALAGLAEVHLGRSNYSEAEELSDRALRMARDVGDLRTEARALRAVSDTYHFQSRLDDAYDGYSRLVGVWEGMGDEDATAAAWHNLGWVSNSKRDFIGARRCFKKAEELYRRVGNIPRLANSLAAQGAIDIDSGQFLTAAETLQESLHLAGESRGRRTAALCHVNLGQAFYRLGQFDRAVSQLTTAKQLFQILDATRYLAPVEMTFGWVLTAQGEYTQAEAHLSQARETYMVLENQPGLASCLAAQADSYRQSGDALPARFWSERGVELARESEDRQSLSTCLISHSLASCNDSGSQEAFQTLHEARKIAREIGAQDTEHLANLAICEVAIVQGHPETVLRSVPGLLKRAESEQLLADRPTIYLYLAQARLMTGDLDAAIQALYDALETAETACTFDTNLRIHELHLAFSRQNHEVGDPKNIEAKYRALIRQTRTAISDTVRAESFARFSRERCRVLGELIESQSTTKTISAPSLPEEQQQVPAPVLADAIPASPPMARAEPSIPSAPSELTQADPGDALTPEIRGIFNLLLDRAIHSTASERGGIFLLPELDKPEGNLQPVAIRNLVRESLKDASSFSRSVLKATMQGQEPVTLTAGTAKGDIQTRDPWTERAKNTHAILATPIVIPENHSTPGPASQNSSQAPASDNTADCHGVLYLERRISSKPYTAAQERLSWHFSRQAARILTATSNTIDDTMQAKSLDKIAHDLDMESIETALPVSDGTSSLNFGSICLVGAGPGMGGVLEAIRKFSDGSVPVLIQGETGTGKELVARALHEHGARASAPFVAVDCGALADNLAESELFGHSRGAFSGAHRDRPGLLRSAENGTLFLDEIGNLSASIQLKLLRALESREVRPLGCDRTYSVSFRLVAATNSDLAACVKRREFRADLYHRLRGGFIQIPPLRHRPEDLEPLVAYLLQEITAKNKRPVPDLAPQAWHLLRRHDWPGNVRELKLALEVALQINEGKVLEAQDFQQSGIEVSDTRSRPGATSRQAKTEATCELPLEVAGLQVPPKLEGRMLLGSMVEHAWDKAAAARAIGWSRQRLYRQLKIYGIPLRVTDTQLQELQSRVEELGLTGMGDNPVPHSRC